MYHCGWWQRGGRKGARRRARARAPLCARGRRPGLSRAGHCVRGPEPTSHTVRRLFHYRARLGSDSLTPVFTPPKENGFCYKTELFSLLAFGGVLKEAVRTLRGARARAGRRAHSGRGARAPAGRRAPGGPHPPSAGGRAVARWGNKQIWANPAPPHLSGGNWSCTSDSNPGFP